MGAASFSVVSAGPDAKKAFWSAVESAQYDNGHAGYTGTVAEKEGYTMIELPEDWAGTPLAYAHELIDKADPRIDNKWGPAGCIDLKDGTYLFFGWASE